MHIEIYDYSEPFLGYLAAHPHLAVLAAEPIAFAWGLWQLFHSIRIQNMMMERPFPWRHEKIPERIILTTAGFWSVLAALSGGLWVLLGMLIGAVAAKGHGIAIMMLFETAPAAAAFCFWFFWFRRSKHGSISRYVTLR